MVISQIINTIAVKNSKEYLHLQLIQDELIKTQENLESCSFITSHIFRAHIARIIGLINLMKHLENEKEEVSNMMLSLKDELISLNRSIQETKSVFTNSVFPTNE